MSLEQTLDVRDQLCPMPVIKTQNQLNSMSPGDVLKVICTDPGALEDIPAWCRVHGQTLLDTNHQDGEIVFLIRKESTKGSVMA